MPYQISIPPNQIAAPNDAIKVIFKDNLGNDALATQDELITKGELWIRNTSFFVTKTETQLVVFWADEFDRCIHGVRGINKGLTHLCKLLS